MTYQAPNFSLEFSPQAFQHFYYLAMYIGRVVAAAAALASGIIIPLYFEPDDTSCAA